MKALELSRRYEAPPEKVFEVFTDLERAPERISAIRGIEVLSDGPIGVGTRFRETRVEMRREATELLVVTAFDPPRSYSVGAESRGASYLTRFDFSPDGTGTRVDISFQATPLSVGAKLLAPLSALMRGTFEKILRQDLDDLASAVEGSA